jgi:hypothetical protein
MQPDIAELSSTFETRCHAAGLDVVHPFCVDWYNWAVDPSSRIQDFGRPTALGFIVGNSRAFWKVFKADLKVNARLRQAAHPIDDYVMSCLATAARAFPVRQEILWAHTIHPRAFPIQRIAEAAGLACLSPSHLSIHPTYGPWHALRAVVVVDADGPRGAAPRAANPCRQCPKPCMDALDQAMASSGRTPSGETIRRHWQKWVSVRDACPEGRAYRYADDHIEYHYSKNRAVLTLEEDS